MKQKLLLLLLLIVAPIFAQQKQQIENKELITKYTLDEKILIEDKNGHLITDSVARRLFFTKRQEEINLYNTRNNNSKKLAQTIDAVQICTNGGFEEFETLSGSNVLKNFKSTVGYPSNPTQCKSVSLSAEENIKQYDPNDYNLMVSTIPSNFLDQYIGNINAFDQFALKLNFKESSSTLAIVQAKRFKANNETLVKFNFKTVLQSITSSDHDNEQPYFKARVLDKNNVVVSEFCVVGDPEDCIFTQANDLEGGSIILYTKNWQNGTLDISSIPNNEEFTVEFMTARCGLSGHFGYTYIDDICFLHSTENSQGSIELEPLNKICPTFPISVCGNFTLPNSGGISANVKNITLNVYDETSKVIYTTSTTSSLDLVNNHFCFELIKSNFPNTTSGTYNVGVTIDYGIDKTSCKKTSFNSASDNDANPGWDISFMNCTSSCNFTIQSGTIEQCDANSDGTENFDLSNLLTQVIGTQTGLTLKYYKNITDATNDTNEIKNYTAYDSGTATVFVRVTKTADCFKIIAANLILKNPTVNILGSLNICGGSTVLTATKGQSYLWSNGEKTQSISATATGIYSVEVTDPAGCISKASITIPTNQVAPQPTIEAKQPDCFVNTGTITITSDASEYSFDGGNTWTTNSSKSNLPVGEYLIKVKTSLGCISYNTRVTINPFYLSYPNFTYVNPSSCNGYGSITITTPAFEYSFDNGVTWTKNNSSSTLVSGTYNIRTKNQFGCISAFNTVTLNSEFLQAPYYTVIQPKCGVGGSIKITTVAASYSFDNGLTWSTNPLATDLAPGTYNIMIKNDLGCISYSQYVNLETYYLTYPTYTTIQPKCGKGGTINIKTKAAEYSFDNGVTWTTNPIATDLPSGTYYVVIKNDLGCKSNPQYVNLDYYFLDYPTFTVTQPVCGAGGTISFDTTAAEYSFDNGTTWTTNPVATDLQPGYYSLVYKNDLGCMSYAQYAYLNAFYLPAPTFTRVQPTCEAGGTITITTPATTYSFDLGNTWTTNPTATDLPPGYYYILYKNDLNCISSYQSVNLDYYLLPSPTYEAVSPSCGNVGSIKITTPADFYSFDYGYTWTTNPVSTNLAPGYYNLKIKNKLGCESGIVGVYLDSNYLANPNFEVIQPTCGKKGSITITTKADFYSFDNGSTWTTNPTLSNLEPNTYYYFLIKNSNGCTSLYQYVYLNPFYLDNPSYTVVKPTCGNNGNITITTTSDFYSFDNGTTWTTNNVLSNPTPNNYYYILIKNSLGCTSNYQYVYIEPFYLDNPKYTVLQPSCGVAGNITITTKSDFYSFDNGNTWTTNPVFSNPNPNSYYSVLIKNNLGCTSNYQNIFIKPFYLDNPDFTYEPAICGKGASITITTLSDFYSFDNGYTWTTNPIASNLSPGYYYIVIKNKLGCISNYQYVYVDPFYLDSPTFEVVNPSCSTKGSITITTPADKYSFDNGVTWTTDPVFSNITTNYYLIKIKNNQGCESNSQYAYIQSIPFISAKPNFTSIMPSNCGVKDGSITITNFATLFSFDNGVTWITNPSSGPLEAGTYQVRIKEYNSSCPSEAAIVVLNSNTALPAPIYSTVQPTCATNTGSITITAIAAQYSFDNGITWQNDNTKSGFLPGDYLVKIKSDKGCIYDAATVKISTNLSYKIQSYSVESPLCVGASPNGLVIKIDTPASEYSFDNGVTWSTNATATNLKGNTEYCLRIKNTEGCISEPTCMTTIKQVAVPQAPQITIKQPVGCDPNGSITVNTIKSQYSFDDGKTWTKNQTSVALTAGTYYIRTKESDSECISEAIKAVINTPPDAPKTPESTVNQPTTCVDPFGIIQFTSLAAEYSFDNGKAWTTNPISGKLAVGSYILKAKNAIGCESNAVTIKIERPTDYPVAPVFNITQPDCSNIKGKITITNPAAEYSFDNGVTWSTSQTSNLLKPGDYQTRVKNLNGCLSEASIATIIPFTNFPLRPTSPKTQTFCIDENATLENVAITGTSIKWYDSLNDGNILANTISLTNNTYYASQTINGCESERIAITIKIQDTQGPIGDPVQAFCEQQNSSIKDISINGEDIKWFSDSTGGVELSEFNPLENGITYYASQTINNCESDRIPVTVRILEPTTVECINYMKELPFPKFFTPNNDGYNDTWTIDFAYLQPNTTIRIYNRYGKLIKEVTIHNSWDGTYLGEDEPASDYWFTVTRLNGTEYRSHFSLKR